MLKSSKEADFFRKFSYKTVLKSLGVGVLAGISTVLFRLCITWAFSGSQMWVEFARTNIWAGVIWFFALFLGGIVVGKLLKKEPKISGSGIPILEGELKNDFSQKPLRILISKFAGGVIAMGAGLSLGREGPCIQMGSVLGKSLAKKDDINEKNLLLTAGGAAGLAAAFNAPLAGIMFALEEVHKSIKIDILITTAVACAVSTLITHIVLGNAPIFQVDLKAVLELKDYWLLIMLGVVTGVIGAFYNYSIKKMQQGYGIVKKIPSYYKIIFPFMLSGILAFVFPYVLGGGEDLVGKITNGSFTIFMVLMLLLVKFVFSVFCFSSGVPGGILMPLIVMGALIGGAFGMLTINDLSTNFALYAMAALFGAVVRAPITGILLVYEMSGVYTAFLPLTITTLTACLVAELLKSKPIYDQLLERTMAMGKNADKQP